MTKEQRKARDADFKRRELPRVLWDSQTDGPAIRVVDSKGHVKYHFKPVVAKKSKARKLTEAEYNAQGRAKRRRENFRTRAAKKPHAAR